MSPESELKEKITKAFANVEFPGDKDLRGSSLGDEPFLLEEDFRGKADWKSLSPEFLDQAPDGYSSALSFFSDKAFRFYIPAYMIADVNKLLSRADPEFHLWHGLTDDTKDEVINERLYGRETWFDYQKRKFSLFDPLQADAVIAFLRYCHPNSPEQIEQALNNYWMVRDRL